MKIINYILSFSFVFIISSCKNEIKQDTISSETAINTDTLAVVDTSAQKYPIWILEFQRLRQALYQNDTATIKSFFDFPLTDEQSSGLSSFILFTITDDNYPPAYSFNSEKDIKNNFSNVFSHDLIKSILTIKCDSLLMNKSATTTTWKLPNDNTQYSSSIIYDELEKTMSLFLNAAYGIEADGNEENKTESAAILIFKFNKENKIKFNRVIMAG